MNSVLDPVQDHFARSQFFDMSEDEKLDSPAFESMKCGVSVSKPSVANGPVLQVSMQYDTLVYNGATRKFESGAPQTVPDTLLTAVVLTGSAGLRAANRQVYKAPGRRVKIASLSYAVASVADQSHEIDSPDVCGGIAGAAIS